MTIKLTIELVPSTSWFVNVRSAVSPKQWKSIRAQVCSRAYDTCEICGGIGPKHSVECHEIWSYNDVKKLRTLEGMIALCPDCHMVKHFGLAMVNGKEEQAFRHFKKINKLTMAQAREYIAAAFVQHHIRSQSEWTVDISHLSEYGIDTRKVKGSWVLIA